MRDHDILSEKKKINYKKLLSDNGLPDIRWHDLRAAFCTLLLKNDFNPKAVSKLMGHAKELLEIMPEVEEYLPGDTIDDTNDA